MFCGIASDRDTSLVYLLASQWVLQALSFYTRENHLGGTMGYGYLLDQGLGFQQLG